MGILEAIREFIVVNWQWFALVGIVIVLYLIIKNIIADRYLTREERSQLENAEKESYMNKAGDLVNERGRQRAIKDYGR